MNKQDYRKIEFTTKETFTLKKHEIVTYKLKGYTNVYVSNTCHIKPKGLHIILKNVNEAMKDFKICIDNLKIIIVSNCGEISSFGSYRAIENEVYLNEIISDKEKLKFEGIKLGHIERHEMWHVKQALVYKALYGNISQENFAHYLNYTNIRAKKCIDSLNLNEDNIAKVSKYAYSSYSLNRYDEIEAEIKAKKGVV